MSALLLLRVFTAGLPRCGFYRQDYSHTGEILYRAGKLKGQRGEGEEMKK
jgi:hypothetical protein